MITTMTAIGATYTIAPGLTAVYNMAEVDINHC